MSSENKELGYTALSDDEVAGASGGYAGQYEYMCPRCRKWSYDVPAPCKYCGNEPNGNIPKRRASYDYPSKDEMFS